MTETPISDRLQDYLDHLVPSRPDELFLMEEHARAEGFPIIGPACGYFCYQIARLVQARQIFELGSGFGYSTAWFARAVRENGGGVVHHTVWDQDLSDQARRHLSALGYQDLVAFHVAEAVSALAEQSHCFDLIFSDIDKEGYPGSLPVIEQRLRPGGVLLVDNLLWGNRIFDPDQQDPATEGVRAFTRALFASEQWIGSIIPIRDGLLLAQRR